MRIARVSRPGARLCFALAVAVAASAAAAGDPAEWSTRLLQEKARIERLQQRLDAANAACAKALASGDAPEHLRALKDERRALGDSLASAERDFPALVRAAREDGVGEEILRPYRFAAPPAAAP